jgi:excisionase family DNA binding protein
MSRTAASTSSLAAALLDALDDATLDALAERLAPRLAGCVPAPDNSTAWLTVKAAAEHLACPPSRLYALVSSRRIPFHKDGSRTLFDRRELDEWVRNGGGTRP